MQYSALHMKCRPIISAITLVLAACTPGMSQQQVAFLHELADRPVTCEAGGDCDDKWNRAIEWVNAHSETGIRTINPNLIQTYLIYTGDKTEKYPEFSVVKYKKRDDVFTVTFTSYCDYGIPCNPSAIKRRADFVTFVLGPPAGVTVHGDTATKMIHTP